MNDEVLVVVVNEIEHYRHLLQHARRELGVAKRLGDPMIIEIFEEDIAHYTAQLKRLIDE